MGTLERALPADWSVRDGRDAYLAENGFTVEGYDEPWTKASFFVFDFVVPNTKRHADAIRLHDLHHVVTGYGTDLPGEAEISAWELRRGVRSLGAYVGAIVCAGAAMGLLVAPRRTIRAWRRAGGERGSLFGAKETYDDLLALKVGELRAKLGVEAGGIAEEKRALHKNAPRGVTGQRAESERLNAGAPTS